MQTHYPSVCHKLNIFFVPLLLLTNAFLRINHQLVHCNKTIFLTVCVCVCVTALDDAL